MTQVNIGLALALLRGLAKDEVRTGAWEEKKVLMVVIIVIIMVATKSTSVNYEKSPIAGD